MVTAAAVGVAVEITVRNMITIRLTVHLGPVKEKRSLVFYANDLIQKAIESFYK